MTAERYKGNQETFSSLELDRVRSKRVCIIGCGGLGGFVANALARFGVGHLTVVDGDTFSTGNLNRQMFSTEETLGQNKALVCKAQLKKINSTLPVAAIPQMLDETNAPSILQGHHLAMDCLDSAPARLLLAKHCATLSIPIVHGALGGYFGQVANIFPGKPLMHILCGSKDQSAKSVEKQLGNPVFTAQAVAALQVNEALKLLAEKEGFLRNQILAIDLMQNTLETILIQM